MPPTLTFHNACAHEGKANPGLYSPVGAGIQGEQGPGEHVHVMAGEHRRTAQANSAGRV